MSIGASLYPTLGYMFAWPKWPTDAALPLALPSVAVAPLASTAALPSVAEETHTIANNNITEIQTTETQTIST